jgi:hypothetical protein
MMQRLVHSPDIVGRQARGHRLDALTLTGQQQRGAVVLQRNVAIGVPCGFRQALQVSRKAFLLWAWP